MISIIINYICGLVFIASIVIMTIWILQHSKIEE